VFAASTDRIYKLNNTSLAWDDASGGTYSALPTGYHWQFAQFGNFVVAVQPNVVPQVYDLGLMPVTFSALGGAPQAAYVAVVRPSTVLSGLLSTPFHPVVRLNAITTWTAGVNRAISGSAGQRHRARRRRRRVRRDLPGHGHPPDDLRGRGAFVFDRPHRRDKGLLAPYSLIRAGDKIFFLASQGFHEMLSTGVPMPIGKEKFDRTFFADYDQSQLQLIVGAARSRAEPGLWSLQVAGRRSQRVRQDPLLRLRARSSVDHPAERVVSRDAVAAG
jgi:hypothetical protein